MRSEAELTNRLNELAIQFRPTPIRIAALYIDLIEATHAFFFHETIGLREYSFHEESFEDKVLAVSAGQITRGVEIKRILPAILSKGLLNHLFSHENQHGIPAYVAPAIDNIRLSGEPERTETAAQTEERRRRVMQRVLPDHQDWNKKREEFYETHPITKHAVRTTVLNFWNNIAQCCGRVLADWETISSIFFPGEPIQKLTEIKATDSDPHKGGKQVLILIFDLKKKLVYKPSDIEADCLLIGQSDPRNNDLRGIFEIRGKRTQSLMEIINTEIKKTGEQKLQLLPTYKILPRNPGSKIADNEIRNSYGYIEFLSHEDSDYKIERIKSTALVDQKKKTGQKQRATKIAWSETAGQLMALAVTFSLTDLHAENMIAHQYKPYLIDLETSLTNLVEKIKDTEINRPFMDPKYDKSYSHCLRMNGRIFLVDQYEREVLSSFVGMLRLLESLKGGEPFRNWCERLAKVITRVVPFATPNLQKILDNVYKEQAMPQEKDHDHQLRDAIDKEFPFKELQIFREPKHLLTKHKQFIEDFKNLDIPVFYHRIGTLYLMNSTGQRVEVVALQNNREYFLEDTFAAIKKNQIDTLDETRIKKLTQEHLEYWPGQSEEMVTILKGK
jgi:hypothetical protein